MKLLDLETTGLSFKKDKIIGVGTDTGFYTDLTQVKKELEQDSELVGQNIKFDIKFLRANGIKCTAGFDTMIAASLLPDKPSALDLETLALHYLPGQEKWKEMVNRKKLSETPLEKIKEYCLKDVDVTKRVAERLFSILENRGMLNFYYNLILPAHNMLIDMEERGMRINVDQLGLMKQSYELQIEIVKSVINNHIPGVNLNSPKQLNQALLKLGYNLLVRDKTTMEGKYSASKQVLESLPQDELISNILKYRHLNKLHGFLKSWEIEHVNGYLHPSFNLAGTRTGRLSCSDPNLQQIPRDKTIRSLFIPSPGYVFIIADYAQIEPRIAAHLSQDEALMKVFKENLDFYGTIAKDILGADCHPNEVKTKYPQLRKVAKEIGLSILYGVGSLKLQSQIQRGTGIVYSIDQCEKFIRDYFIAYPRLRDLRDYIRTSIRYIDRVVRDSSGKPIGGTVRNHFGRINFIEYKHQDVTGVNTLVQSTASDAMLFGASKLYQELKEKQIDARPVALVHDEIILECKPEYVNIVKELMNEILTSQSFTVPLKLDIAVGDSWAEKG